MFYYLLNHSSLLNKQNEKAKKLSIILFGSLIYLSIHAFLSFNKNNIIQKIKPYFWLMFLLDIFMSYYSFIYKSKDDDDVDNDESLDNKQNHNFIEEIFSIKNKITDIISSNKMNNMEQNNENNSTKNNNEETTELQKEKDSLILQLKEDLKKSKNHSIINTNNDNKNENETILNNKMSTPIKNLKKNIQIIKNTPNIELLNIKEENPIIKENIELNDSASESGSEMDFDISDFKNSLD
jgi:hypothetical protein